VTDAISAALCLSSGVEKSTPAAAATPSDIRGCRPGNSNFLGEVWAKGVSGGCVR